MQFHIADNCFFAQVKRSVYFRSKTLDCAFIRFMLTGVKNFEEMINELDSKLTLARNETEQAKQSQAKRGKKTARERIALLLDEESFVEIDSLASHRKDYPGSEKYVPAEGVVTGYGTVNGRPVFVFSQDFSVVGGSLSLMQGEKIMKVMDMAMKTQAPIIGINDSGGARVQEGVDALSGYGKIFYKNAILSGSVPQISLVLGPCAGGATYSPALTDFIFMVEGISEMFITGPQVIESVTGERPDKQELGGARVHASKSGVTHFVHSTEEESFKAVRKLISYLPQNASEKPPRVVIGDNPNRMPMTLRDIVPTDSTKPYDVHKVITEIIDHGEFLEVQPDFAKNLVIGFARIDGFPVGIVANQPLYLAGCLDIDSSDKAAKFIRTCDSFNVPLVNLVDVPGFLPGVSQEHGGIIRHGAKMLFSYSEATVPKITIITRRSYGGSYLAMCSRDMGADLVYAWPQANIAVMGSDGAVRVLYSDELKNAANPKELQAKLAKEYEEYFCNPYIAAERGYVDEVIKPEETRIRIASALHLLKTKQESRPPKKHGNIPL